MPRRLDSLNLGGYVEPIDVVEAELETVIDMLGITDAQQSRIARDRICFALVDLKTARSRTVNAKHIRDDLRDLNELEEATNPETMSVSVRRATDVLDSLRTNNPVLYQRLKLPLPGQKLRDRTTFLRTAGGATFAIGKNFSADLPKLMDEIRSEDGRGRPRDVAAFKLAVRLHRIWHYFTGRPTSRQNAFGRERDPFGDFVDAAGRLVEPGFNGHWAARQFHDTLKEAQREESPPSPS